VIDGPRRRVQDLSDGEQSDCHHDHVDSVEELRDAERQPGRAGERIDPDHTEQESEQEAGRAVQPRFAEHGGDGNECDPASEKYSAGRTKRSPA
jgi:hypothetical protein